MEWLHSYTLTINADAHSQMNHLHNLTDENRMIAILPADRYQPWPTGAGEIADYMRAFEADQLRAEVPAVRQTQLP